MSFLRDKLTLLFFSSLQAVPQFHQTPQIVV